MKKSKNGNRVSDFLFRQILFRELNKANDVAHTKTAFYQFLQTKMRKSIDRQRSLRLHSIYYAEWAALAQGSTDNAIAKKAATNAKKDLLQKDSIIEIYQQQISEFQAQLNGEKKFTYYIGSKIFNSHAPNGSFTAPVHVMLDIHKAMRDTLSEINKLSGNYAPTKIASTDSMGNDLRIDTKAMPTNLLVSLATFILNDKNSNDE